MVKLKFTWSNEPWRESLIGCPSQLYKGFRIEKVEDSGVTWTLLDAEAYCRWRWSDPWTASVLKEIGPSLWIADCIPDVPNFSEDEHKELEAWVEVNFPRHAAEIVEASLKEEAQDLEERRKRWEATKVELGIKW
jgi:hypothetical protein